MTILAVDTATRWTGLALHDGSQLLAEQGWYSRQNQTTALAIGIETILDQAGLSVTELSGLAVTTGPGSYTGLRIGMGTVKGMSLALRLPLIGIPTLDVLTYAIGALPRRKAQLAAVVEAGRRRICVGFYQWSGRHGWEADGDPLFTSWEELLPEIDAITVFAGEFDGEIAREIRRAGSHFSVLPPASCTRRAGSLAELGWQRLKKKMVDDPALLAPIYLREPGGG